MVQPGSSMVQRWILIQGICLDFSAVCCAGLPCDHLAKYSAYKILCKCLPNMPQLRHIRVEAANNQCYTFTQKEIASLQQRFPVLEKIALPFESDTESSADDEEPTQMP